MGKKIVGFSIRTNNHAAMHDLHEHWMRYEDQKQRLPVRAREIYVVYSNYEKGMEGDYDYLIGREMPDDFEPSEDMTVIEVPDPSEMKAFEVQGEMPGALIEAWGEIWANEEGLNRTYLTDYETYPLADANRATIYLGVKG